MTESRQATQGETRIPADLNRFVCQEGGIMVRLSIFDFPIGVTVLSLEGETYKIHLYYRDAHHKENQARIKHDLLSLDYDELSGNVTCITIPKNNLYRPMESMELPFKHALQVEAVLRVLTGKEERVAP